MKLLGVDPGLAALGLAVVELEADSVRVLDLRVIRTHPCAKKRRIRRTDDLGDRLRIIAEALHHHYLPLPGLVAVCVEAAAVPYRHGRLMTKPSTVAALGRVRGTIDALAAWRGLPVVEETPQAIKRLLTGRQNASKLDVQKALEARFPEVATLWPQQRTLREHRVDALAAVVAGLETDVVRAARRGAA